MFLCFYGVISTCISVSFVLKFYLRIGEPSSLTAWKKRKTENEYSLCLICQEQSTVKVIKNPNNESLKKFLSLSRERAEYGDTKIFEFVEKIKNLCADGLLNNSLLSQEMLQRIHKY